MEKGDEDAKRHFGAIDAMLSNEDEPVTFPVPDFSQTTIEGIQRAYVRAGWSVTWDRIKHVLTFSIRKTFYSEKD